jgi:hypothetical protein
MDEQMNEGGSKDCEAKGIFSRIRPWRQLRSTVEKMIINSKKR